MCEDSIIQEVTVEVQRHTRLCVCVCVCGEWFRKNKLHTPESVKAKIQFPSLTL